LPLMVLKSSATASDADRTAKIASVVAQQFTRRILPLLPPHSNGKMLRSGRNDARDLHGCDCASLQCANCHTASRHIRSALRMSRRSRQRSVGSKERYIASAHRSERNSGRQAIGRVRLAVDRH